MKKGKLKKAVAASVLLFSRDALAIDAITQKVEAIKTVCATVAGIIVGIGAIWCGLKFIKGDQDSWAYTWKFMLGATIVFSAGHIVAWLQT